MMSLNSCLHLNHATQIPAAAVGFFHDSAGHGRFPITASPSAVIEDPDVAQAVRIEMEANRVTDTVRIKACTDFNRFHGNVGPGPGQVSICKCASCVIMQIRGSSELTKFGDLPLSACKSLVLNLQSVEEWGKLPVDLKNAWTVFCIDEIAYHVYENLLIENPGESRDLLPL